MRVTAVAMLTTMTTMMVAAATVAVEDVMGIIKICALKPVTFACPLAQCQLLVWWWEDAQTEHMRHHPWCGDDIYALGLGVLGSHAMVGAIAAGHHS